MIQLHQFLVYVLKYLDTNDEAKKYCEDYLALNISPHHIHRTKAEHKHAIFVLCKIISQVINANDPESLPESVSNSLNDLVLKSLKEIQAE